MTTTPTFYLELGTGALLISGSAPVYGPSRAAYVFHKLTGWDEPPGLRLEGVARTGAHGSTAGKSYLGDRTLVLEGHVIVPAGDPAVLRDAVDALMAAIPLEDELLVVHEHGLTRHLYVRQGGQPTADRIGRREGRHVVAAFNIQLVALDPRRLHGDGTGPTETGSTDPGIAGTVALDLGAGPEAPVSAHIAGPCNKPQVSVGGRTLVADVELHPGQVLHLDLERRRATLDGVDVTLKCTGRWPVITKGRFELAYVAHTLGGASFMELTGTRTYP